MTDHRQESAPIIEVSVKVELVSQLGVGTRWEVVDASLDTLWNSTYSVTLKRVD